MKRILIVILSALLIVAGTSPVQAAPVAPKAYTIAYVQAQIDSGNYVLTSARVRHFKRTAKLYETTYRFERDRAICEATIKTLVKPDHPNYGKGDPMVGALTQCLEMVVKSNRLYL